MPFEVFLALRYLKSRRRRRLARVTALVAMLGIAAGVAALIVALALANGFRDEMREKILRGTAHLTVIRSDGEPLSDYRSIAVEIKKIPGVNDAVGTTYDAAMIVGPKGTAYSVLRGVDSASPATLNQIGSSLSSGSTSGFGAQQGEDRTVVLLGTVLANQIGVNPGDTAELIPLYRTAGMMLGMVPERRAVRVGGLVSSGLFEYDSTWIYLPLETAAKFADGNHGTTVISVQVADIYSVNQIAAQIRSRLGNSYKTIEWQEANRPLFTALALERRMGLFVIALIIVIAALNITTTLILVVVERGRDIGILNAMGASSKSIMGIFMLEGAIIGAIGGLIGVLLGTLACLIGNRYQLVSLPADVYSISNIPFHIQLRDVALAVAVAFVLSLIATIYPARAAARVRPVEMLRETN